MRLRRDPEDDYLHPVEADATFNESRYYNFSGAESGGATSGVGGWVRMGNRPNEGHAEMMVCLYLPGGRVGFMFRRAAISGHEAHDAAGLRFEVVTPYQAHHVTYDGDVCVLAHPRDMADPKSAFTSNPHAPVQLDLHLAAAAQPFGGEPEWDEGEVPPPGSQHGFARGHTEQHMMITGTVVVGDEQFVLTDAVGFRDHSWGPRVWQAIPWYRWLNACFGPLGIAFTLRGWEGGRNINGFVYDVAHYGNDRIVRVDHVELTTEYDDELFPVRNVAVVTAGDRTYELRGEIWSDIPLRNRRDGKVTRITESMTRWTCNGLAGAGLTEHLDQIVDDVPLGNAAGA